MLDNPSRVQGLAKRHLALRPVDPLQYDKFDSLPERRVPLVPGNIEDPIGAIIERDDEATGSIGQLLQDARP
jgi:hypothetical protein